MQAVTYDKDSGLVYIHLLHPKESRNVRSEELKVNDCILRISAKTAKSPDSNVLVRQHCSVPRLPGNHGYM